MATFIGILKVVGTIAGGIAALYGLIALIAYIALSVSEYRSKRNTPVLDGIGKVLKYVLVSIFAVFLIGGLFASCDDAEEAYSDGYGDGYDEAYDEAYQNGYDAGYWDGYEQALLEYGIDY